MSKHNYLCIQRSPAGQPQNSQPPSPAQMQEMFAQFTAWKERFQGSIVDMGGRLGGGKIVTSTGATDGPFVEAKEVIGGYMIVSAETIAEAVEIARQSPGCAMPGSSVEVREISTP
ncbi:MAG TPA: YciI family protein [Steroidobacteraceae bacterium]|nr:YciI family protein [Steroidobacteraceae bacterium]